MDYLKIKELYHDGIKGMKWGIRRYQNYDGTLTEEGKRRYNKGAVEVEKELQKEGKEFKAYKGKDGNYYYKDKNGEEQLFKVHSDQLSDTELVDLNRRVKQENELHKETSNAYEYKGPKADQALREASRLANDISNALPKGTGKTIKKDYSNISDQELRARIQRLQLEDSYGKLSGDTIYVKSGSEKAREILQTAGAILAVASSAAILAGTIRDWKKPRLNQSDILDEDENSLEHHGIKGQKWGFRRYQNPDGSLTEAGRMRYGKTHVNELTDEERSDLARAEAGAARNRRIAIGVGVAVTAATAIIGATWLAKRRQEVAQTTTQQVKQEVVNKQTPHLHEPDTVKPNLFALPAPKKDFIDVDFKDVTPKSSSAKPNIPDWLKKSGNGSKPLSSLKQTVSNTSKYNPRAVTDTYHKTANRYYRLEKDIHGNPFKISKADWAKAPKIHINHRDMSDYLVFKALYHAMIFGISYCASDELYHHGIKGQKWGVRRYQDESGALTPEGRRRYRTDLGTKEILDNSSNYSKITKDQQREYAEYGRRAGAKRGFLTGLAGGALVGLGKTALDVYFKKSEGNLSNASARSIANSFTRNMMLGALGGSVVGTLVGSVAGKKSAQAQLADRGREYVDELLSTPTDRIRGR